MYIFCFAIGELTVAVTGLSGSGKTSVCNFFAGKTGYKTGKVFSVSKQSSRRNVLVNTEVVTLIDTPGFCDINITTYITKLWGNGPCNHAGQKGVHAFAFVFNVTSRFSKAHATALQDFQKLGEVAPYTLVIFTNVKRLADDEEGQKQVISEMLSDSECPEALKEFMQSINYRYMLLESVNAIAYNYYALKSQELMENVVSRSQTSKVFMCYLMEQAKAFYDAQERLLQERQLNVDHLTVHNEASQQLLNALVEVNPPQRRSLSSENEANKIILKVQRMVVYQ